MYSAACRKGVRHLQPWTLMFCLGVGLLAGCQPDGVGSITVDRKDSAVRSLKTFEDAKVSKGSKNKAVNGNNRQRVGFQ